MEGGREGGREEEGSRRHNKTGKDQEELCDDIKVCVSGASQILPVLWSYSHSHSIQPAQ